MDLSKLSRKDFLKGYLLSIVVEGELKGVKTASAAARKAIAVFALDVPSVLAEIGRTALEQNIRLVTAHVGAAAATKLGEIFQSVASKGAREVWRDLERMYWAGADANAKRR